MNTVTRILNQMSVITVDCTIWSGARRLKPEDLVLGQGGQLPSDDVISLGSKKLCNREVLKPFNRLREQAGRLCARDGVRFLGGYAVPDSCVDELAQELDQLQSDFDHEKQMFLAQYDQHIQEWVQAHSDFAEAIRKAVPDAGYVGQRLDFGYTVYKVTASPKPDKLNQQVNRLGSTLREEISREAQTLFEQTFKDKTKVTRKALRPIIRLRDKLNGLAFVDPDIAPLVQRLDEGLAQLPDRGSLEGEALTQLMERVLLLCSVEQMQQCAQALNANKSVSTEAVEIQEKPTDTPQETEEIAEKEESIENTSPTVNQSAPRPV